MACSGTPLPFFFIYNTIDINVVMSSLKQKKLAASHPFLLALLRQPILICVGLFNNKKSPVNTIRT
jgi:hypothetical protein